MEKTIFVVGAGKGLGNAVARKFGADGFRVVLMSRSAEHLADYQREMQSEGLEVATQVADTADQTSLAAAMAKTLTCFSFEKDLYGYCKHCHSHL